MTARTLSLLIAAMIGTAAAGYWVGRQTPNYSHGDTAPNDTVAPAATTAPPARKVLYYRNPMGEADTSPVPKQDSMGMDYIPVYADEVADEPGTVALTPGRIQTLGVRTAVVERRALAGSVHALGRVEADERRLADIAPRFDGWIERLAVNTTGQVVKKGQTLFEVYSPELVSAQREYEVAAAGLAKLANAPADARAGMQAVADAALARLGNWQLTPAQIGHLADSGKAGTNGAAGTRRTLAFASPVDGIVLEKMAVQGMRFMPGQNLYRIADLSSVWVLADVFERDLPGLASGMPATAHIAALPGRQFAGKIDFVYPTLDEATRTVRVRVVLPNPRGELRPGMFAEVVMASEPKHSGGDTAVLTVPRSAVIDGGRSQRVLLALPGGRFAPRTVQLGRRSDDVVEVLDGLAEGDAVVVSANFLIDSESQLRAAFSALTASPDAGATGTTMGQPTTTTSPAPAAPHAGHQHEGH